VSLTAERAIYLALELDRSWTERLGLLVMPLLITLETALVAELDHSENHWKSLLARPVPRWTLYVAKLLVVVAMTAAATFLLLCGVLLDGTILPKLQSEIAFGFPIPLGAIFREGAQVMALVFLALTIQHWVSLRWKSFSVAVGTGIVALAVSFFGTRCGATGRELAAILSLGASNDGTC